MTKTKREHFKRIMDLYFMGTITKEEMYAMIEAVKRRKEFAIYCRVGGGASKKMRKDSLRSQRARLAHYAREKGFTVTSVYEDDGYSGGDLDRPGLKQLLRDYEEGEFDSVLVIGYDRLYRGPIWMSPDWSFDVFTIED